jgi:pimeloyl-ACP methyl ester carboxylesterase
LAAGWSLFKSAEAEALYRAAYNTSLSLWPAGHESLNIPTRFGLTHVLACGPADAPPVLFLPAMAFSATMWYANIPALSNEFRCYAAEFPSDMGLSTMTNPPSNRLDCVAWLRELLDGLGVARACLVGASYGSFLALNYAIAEPGRVAKLVLSSPAAGVVPLRKTFYFRLFVSMLLPGQPAERLMRWLFADRFPLDNPVVQQLLVGTKTLRPRMKVYPGVFTPPELAGIPSPLYLLFGEEEVVYDPRSATARARRLLPKASVEIVPNAGHLLMMERPGFVNRRILTFLLDR